MMATESEALLRKYLALRRAVGFDMKAEEPLLWDFICFLEAHNPVRPFTAQLAVDWARSTVATYAPRGQGQRLTIARGFLRYLSAFDPQVEVPHRGLMPADTRPRPYILSETQIETLLGAARCLTPRGSLRPATIATLIGLLVSAGLRIGEALRLQRHDVDLAHRPPLLRIHNTKFRKSRLVPLHPTTANALQDYRDLRIRLGCDGASEAFFVSNQGKPLNYYSVAHTFLRLARRIGLRGSVGERGPSWHSLRHTFAVRRLVAWCIEGADIQLSLSRLSAYLGHVRPEESYWYLSATPDILRTAATQFESYIEKGEHP